MWVPSHVEILGNEAARAADLEAKRGALSGQESGSYPIAYDYFPLAKSIMNDTGKWIGTTVKTDDTHIQYYPL
jgi:hypothetical protein